MLCIVVVFLLFRKGMVVNRLSVMVIELMIVVFRWMFCWFMVKIY